MSSFHLLHTCSRVLHSAHCARTQGMTVSPPRAQVVSPPRAHFQLDKDCLAAARPGCLDTARPFSSSQLRSHGIVRHVRSKKTCSQNTVVGSSSRLSTQAAALIPIFCHSVQSKRSAPTWRPSLILPVPKTRDSVRE